MIDIARRDVVKLGQWRGKMEIVKTENTFRPLRREPEPVVLELKLGKEDVEKALKNFREENIKALDEVIDKCRKSMLE